MTPFSHRRPPDALDGHPDADRLGRVWSLLDDAPLRDAPPLDAAWAALERRLAPPPSDRAPRRRRRLALFGVSLGLGVGLAVVLVTAIFWTRQPVVHIAPPGHHLTVLLPDGSSVELNSDTRLAYARGFQRWPFASAPTRTMRLEGEAFFDVAHEADRPFVVETFNARVEVLGTRFNVRARQAPMDTQTQVTLASGRVRVTTPLAPGDLVLAEPGATARISPRAAEVATASSARPLTQVLAWRDEGFTAIDRPLAVILAELERRFALTITPGDGLDPTAPMTVFYPRGVSAEQILEALCLAQNCRYRPTATGYILTPLGGEE